MPNPNILASPEPVRGFCDGCARNMGDKCEVINEPWFIEAERGCCWARVTPTQAREIERSIRGEKAQLGCCGKYEKFGAKVVTARLEQGMKQTHLAEKLGIAKASLSRLEKGRINPGDKMAARIAEALGVELETLVGETEGATA